MGYDYYHVMMLGGIIVSSLSEARTILFTPSTLRSFGNYFYIRALRRIVFIPLVCVFSSNLSYICLSSFAIFRTGNPSAMSNSGECDRFSQLSDEFMCWLKQNPGVRVSPKIKIADLRFEGAGRGIGMFVLLLFSP